MYKGIFSRILILMNTAFAALMIILVYTIYTFMAQSEVIVTEGRHRMLQNYAVEAENTFASIDVHLSEVMTKILEEGSEARFRGETTYIRNIEARKYYELLEQKCSSVYGLDIAFVLDLTREDGVQIWSYGEGVDKFSKSNFRTFLESKRMNLKGYGAIEWQPYELENDLYYLKLYRFNGFVVGALCSENHFSSEIQQSIAAEGGTYKMFLVNKDGTLLYRNFETSLSDEQLLSRQKLHNQSVVTEPYRKRTGTINVVFPDTVGNFVKNVAVIGILFFWGICFVLEALIYGYLRKYVMKPVEQMVVTSNEIIGGNYNALVEENGQGEMLVMEKAFNATIKNVVDLQIDSYEQELHAKEQELVRLRQQLKPHFYLNALAVVKGMAYQQKTEDIQKYIEALTIHIRYLLNNKETMTTLGEEFEHVVNYAAMQKICTPGKTTAFIHCDPDCRSVQVPYLILHTIVENAMKHARMDNNSLMFTLSATRVEEDGFIGTLIEYEDTGAGFSDESLRQFSEEKPAAGGEHVGLANLKSTMEIQYGCGNLMRILNASPHGARVEIRIPDGKE